MARKFNPFHPTSPVYHGMFSGRFNEINGIDQAMYQTKNGNPNHIMLLGERGIGKTSLLLVANGLARGDFDFSGEKYNFLSIQVNLDDRMSITDLAISIKNRLKRELRKINPEISLMENCWAFISQVECMGVSITKNVQSPSIDNNRISEELTYSLIDTVKNITHDTIEKKIGLTQRKDGIVILIDESDRANKELNLGAFLKKLTESLTIENCNNILFIVAGLPSTKDVLADSHESSLRIFQEYCLNPLSQEEVNDVIRNGLEQSKKCSQTEIKIEEEALKSIYDYSEGYPHFVQQIGYSVFEVNNDDIIEKKDVTRGFFGDGGALDIIGAKYYEKLYYKDIRTDAQREILRIMAEQWNGWVSRDYIKLKYSKNSTSLDNGLHALKDKNIILYKSGSRGQYRLQWGSFAFWIDIHRKKV